MSTVRFDRAPQAALLPLLQPGAVLAPVLAGGTSNGLPLDVHLRENNQVHVYCGGTRILRVRLVRDGIRLDGADSYAKQAVAMGVLRIWQAHEKGLATALEAYYQGVVIHPRYLVKEGKIQTGWSRLTTPWVPVDREVVLGYPHRPDQAKARSVPAVRKAQKLVTDLAKKNGWSAPPSKGTAAELDQLAVDEKGRLVLIELKHGSNSAACYAPLQLLQYVYEWVAALQDPAVLAGVKGLIKARQALGLTPTGLTVPKALLRPIIGFGEKRPTAEVWRRLLLVLEIVNRLLPEGVPPIEVWGLEKGKAVRW